MFVLLPIIFCIQTLVKSKVSPYSKMTRKILPFIKLKITKYMTEKQQRKTYVFQKSNTTILMTSVCRKITTVYKRKENIV